MTKTIERTNNIQRIKLRVRFENVGTGKYKWAAVEMKIETAKVIMATFGANQAQEKYPGPVAANATPANTQAIAIKRARISDIGEKNRRIKPKKHISSESS